MNWRRHVMASNKQRLNKLLEAKIPSGLFKWGTFEPATNTTNKTDLTPWSLINAGVSNGK